MFAIVSVLAIIAALAAVAVAVLAARLRRSRREVGQLTKALEAVTMTDEATGVLNRAGLETFGDMLITLARRDSDAVSMCLVQVLPSAAEASDLEDAVITAADAVRAVCRSGDAVARVGPSLLMLVGKGSGYPAAALERRLLAAMSMVHPPGSQPPQLAIGISSLAPWDTGDLATLEADALIDLEVRRVAAAPAGTAPAPGWQSPSAGGAGGAGASADHKPTQPGSGTATPGTDAA